MKNSFYYSLLAAAALSLAACGSDGEANGGGGQAPDDGKTKIVLTSNVSVSRAGTSIQSTAFDTGETVDVTIEEVTDEEQDPSTITTYGTQEYTTGANKALNPPADNPPYFPASGNDVNIYAVYPAATVGAWGAETADDKKTFTIAADQSTDEAYKKSDLMYGLPSAGNPVGRTKEAIPLTFTHLLSKVTINISSGGGSVDVTGAEVALLGVKPAITFSADAQAGAYDFDDTQTATEVKVMALNNSIAPVSGVISGSAVVAPQQLPTRFVRVTLPAGGVFYGSLDGNAAPNLKKSSVHTYNIKIDLTGISMTSEISDWTDGGTGSGSASMEDASEAGN